MLINKVTLQVVYNFEVGWDTEDLKFFARCLEIPGATGTGHTVKDAIEDAKDTLQTYYAHRKELGL